MREQAPPPLRIIETQDSRFTRSVTPPPDGRQYAAFECPVRSRLTGRWDSKTDASGRPLTAYSVEKLESALTPFRSGGALRSAKRPSNSSTFGQNARGRVGHQARLPSTSEKRQRRRRPEISRAAAQTEFFNKIAQKRTFVLSVYLSRLTSVTSLTAPVENQAYLLHIAYLYK